METLVTVKVSLVLRSIMTESDPKERIKQAAHELVMRYSIRSVSMDDIAASVGMSKKTLYHYYQDKDELVTAVVEGVLSENKCVCEGHVNAAENAVHEIFLAMEMMVEMFQTMNPSIIYEMQKYHPDAYQKFHQHKTKFLLCHMEQNLERGVKEELYRPDINPQILARFRVESMFIPFNPDFQRSLNNYNLLQLEEQIITHFLFGLVSTKGHKLAMKYMAEKDKKYQNKN
ncbi:MAG TPA: TetR/AcrR family transcriptional regulator [Ferruginibacter sp.]|nr:TetR/AcrR family transcriptional regulator [Ferruginibacter sp.]